MRVEVSGSPGVHADQYRTYAEYRVFSQLAAVASQVRTVRINVRKSGDDGATVCMMAADVVGADPTRTQARSMKPSVAIDTAAAKLAAAVSKRI